MPDDKKEEVKEQILVVNELPKQQTRVAETEKGEPLKLITIEEAITEMYEDIKEIRKALA